MEKVRFPSHRWVMLSSPCSEFYSILDVSVRFRAKIQRLKQKSFLVAKIYFEGFNLMEHKNDHMWVFFFFFFWQS